MADNNWVALPNCWLYFLNRAIEEQTLPMLQMSWHPKLFSFLLCVNIHTQGKWQSSAQGP